MARRQSADEGKAMTRPRLPYKPKWSREIHGYAHNAIRSFWPALSPWYEWEDLMQEARLTFVLCSNRYTGVVDNPAWFMALFKTAWHNKLISLVGRLPQYSLNEEVDLRLFDFSSPDVMQEMLQMLETLPFSLRLAVKNLCEPDGKRVSKRMLNKLRLALRPNPI